MTYSEHSKRLVRIFLPFLLIALLLFLHRMQGHRCPPPRA